MSGKELYIIIPALNEAETIGKVIDEIPREELEEKGYLVKIMVVDGNSSDLTRQIAQERGAEVIIEYRKGKGRAMRTAFAQTRADFVFMLDADCTYPAVYITDMMDKLNQGYDVVIGSRLKGDRAKGSISRLNIVGNHLLTLMARLLYFRGVSDLCTGYWGFKGEIIPELDLSAEGFNLEADLFSQIAKRSYKMGEIPIYYRRRSTPSKLRSIRAGLRIGWTLIRNRFS